MATAEEKLKRAYMALDGESHLQKQLTLASTGRHVLISYPDDMTDQELMDFTGWLLTGFRAQLPPQGLVLGRRT